MLVVQVVHDLEKQPEPLAALAACPALLALPVLLLLLVDCSGKVEVVAAVVLLAPGVLVVLAVAALVVAAVAQHAVLTRPALVA